MFTYYLGKAQQEQLLREAKQARLVKVAKHAKREACESNRSRVNGRVNRRFHVTHI